MPDWEKYIAIADRFQHKAKFEDREDLRQDIIIRLSEIAQKQRAQALYRGSYGKGCELCGDGILT